MLFLCRSGNMGPRKYYRHVEKENIKSIWRVLHSSTFLLLIINSMISAYVFGDILKMFDYRCVLHVDPIFDLINTQELNETHNELLFFEPVLKIKTRNKENVENNLGTDENDTKVETNDATRLTAGEKLLKFFNIFNTTSEKTVNASDEGVEKMKHSHVYNDTIWYKNESMYGKVNVKIRGSDYGATTSCDLVLFVPLLSLIAAAVFGALTVLFGRGQVSRRSWFMVYPVLTASAIMIILCIIATVSMKNGLDHFCSQFQNHTGFISCSHYMDYFSYNRKADMSGFWNNYGLCYYSYIAAIFLWIIQLIITIIRLSTMADFHFMAVTVDTSEVNRNEHHDEKIHNVLINSGMTPAAGLFSSEEELSAIEINRTSTKL